MPTGVGAVPNPASLTRPPEAVGRAGICTRWAKNMRTDADDLAGVRDPALSGCSATPPPSQTRRRMVQSRVRFCDLPRGQAPVHGAPRTRARHDEGERPLPPGCGRHLWGRLGHRHRLEVGSACRNGVIGLYTLMRGWRGRIDAAGRCCQRLLHGCRTSLPWRWRSWNVGSGPTVSARGG